MAAVNSLDVTTRSGSGTGAARALRREGKVPAIVYGGNGEPVSLSIEILALNRTLSIPGLMAQTLSLNIDGKPETVKLQDVQRHPVTEIPLHIDFVRLSV